MGVAHRFLPGQQALSPDDFSGGQEHAVKRLRELGFTVVDVRERRRLEGLRDRVARLEVSHASGGPALHQPITLLWAIGRARRGEERLLPWTETERELRRLIERHGARGERPHPDHPIAGLTRAGLWELPEHPAEGPNAHGDAGPHRWFAEHRPVSGLARDAHDLLRDSGEARLTVIAALLDSSFDGLDPEPLLKETGLYDEGATGDPGDATAGFDPLRYAEQCAAIERLEPRDHGRRVERTWNAPLRSGAARRLALARANGRCRNPRCTGQPDDVTDHGEPLLEVDHVADLALGGRDHPGQMIALCPNCHALKTRGSRREELRRVLLAVAADDHARALAAASTG
ncbi:HNH endonuclease [Streptomyces radicis]|uniref:HNH endonuclease n=1 Tax=Streptomyces radicis TaxID=1750517 RepID=A0A3A9WUZ6_9ACTN|nr:HNH endonuclease [Streptomyces radicis]RKN26831.1 HNH endonuclease [Streptomyces radicis]